MQMGTPCGLGAGCPDEQALSVANDLFRKRALVVQSAQELPYRSHGNRVVLGTTRRPTAFPELRYGRFDLLPGPPAKVDVLFQKLANPPLTPHESEGDRGVERIQLERHATTGNIAELKKWMPIAQVTSEDAPNLRDRTFAAAVHVLGERNAQGKIVGNKSRDSLAAAGKTA